MSQVMGCTASIRQAPTTPERPDTRVYRPGEPIVLNVVSVPRPVSDDIKMGSVNDRRFRVVEPIAVRCSREGEVVTAEAGEVGEFGVGCTATEAVRDLQRTLVELYCTLEAEQHCLGPDLQTVWATLQQKMARGCSY